ncbi:hypothetical protein T4D_6428 [Trichinella pseudospiralis]|uniref:Uncharacterized protein n=2 Tax=Trichinella pseudospiralis TaxID=6337 RepID=A0A0V1FC99_TRIPS|nr:hypothetical protein T4D_6428 [Trichinella pseudospiralis]
MELLSGDQFFPKLPFGGKNRLWKPKFLNRILPRWTLGYKRRESHPHTGDQHKPTIRNRQNEALKT